MKKIIFTILTFFAAVATYAQTCMPDTTTFPKSDPKSYGIRPAALPDAKSNVAYSQTIQFRFPTDTSYQGTKIHVNNVSIDNVTMPKNFSYKCNKANCTYNGGEYGCVQITGNPVNNQIGTHNLIVHYTANVVFFGASIPLGDSGSVAFKIVANSGVFYGSDNKIIAPQNFPNPFSSSTEIQFTSPTHQLASMIVCNALGEKVYSHSLQANEGSNTITFERNNLPAGMYFYTIQLGNDMVTRRMIIKD